MRVISQKTKFGRFIRKNYGCSAVLARRINTYYKSEIFRDKGGNCLTDWASGVKPKQKRWVWELVRQYINKIHHIDADDSWFDIDKQNEFKNQSILFTDTGFSNGKPVRTNAREKLRQAGLSAAMLSGIDKTISVASAQQFIAGTRIMPNHRIEHLNQCLKDAGYDFSFTRDDFIRKDRQIIPGNNKNNVLLTEPKQETDNNNTMYEELLHRVERLEEFCKNTFVGFIQE